MAARFRTLLGCEFVAAARALRQRGIQPAGPRLQAVYDLCLRRLPADDSDRPLDLDIAAAEQVIAAMADDQVTAQ